MSAVAFPEDHIVVRRDNAAATATGTEYAGTEYGDAHEASGAPYGAPRYWPTELLATFTLLMAGHGRCVSSAMMLGDREYALWQLARAHTMDDDRLREVAVQLFSYFDDAQHWTRATVLHA